MLKKVFRIMSADHLLLEMKGENRIRPKMENLARLLSPD